MVGSMETKAPSGFTIIMAVFLSQDEEKKGRVKTSALNFLQFTYLIVYYPPVIKQGNTILKFAKTLFKPQDYAIYKASNKPIPCFYTGI